MYLPPIRSQSILCHVALALTFFICLGTNRSCVSQEVTSQDALLLAKIKPAVTYESDSDGNVISISANGTQSGFDAFGEFTELQELVIDGEDLQWADLQDLSRLDSLKKLSLVDRIPRYNKKTITLPPLPNSLESLELKLPGMDPEVTLTAVGQLTNLTSLTIPFSDGGHILKLEELKNLKNLQLTIFLDKSERFAVINPRQPSAFFQLLVDMQGRSSNEACEILGLIKDNAVKITLTDRMPQYINQLKGVTDLKLDIRSTSQAALSKLEIPFSVESLSLSYGKPSEALLTNIGSSKALSQLDFNSCKFSNFQHLKKMSWLKNLKLHNCIINSDAISFADGFAGLKVLDIDSFESTRLTVPVNSNTLEQLLLAGSKLEIENFSDIASLKSLRKLELTVKTEISEAALKDITALEHLTDLKLLNVTAAPDHVFNFLDQMENLEQATVNADGMGIGLSASGLDLNIGAKLLISDKITNRLTGQKNLKEISVFDSSILTPAESDLVFQTIGTLDTIEKVVLTDVPSETGGVFDVLVQLEPERLEFLKIGRGLNGILFKRTKDGLDLKIGRKILITDKLVNQTSSIKNWNRISFSRSKLQRDDLPAFAQIQAAQISFSRCENITSKTVELLSRNKNIKTLRFSGCDKIDDEAVAYFEKMTWLENLKLDSESVSETSLESLRTKLPNCKID